MDRTEIPEPFGRIDGLNQGRPRRGVLLKALDVSGVEQSLRVGMGWLFQHGVDLAGLNDASVLHHQHPVGDGVHDIEVVGDENDAHVPLALDFLKERQNGFLHRGIQSGRGFIGDEHFRIGGQGQGNHDPLLLPTAHFVRVLVERRFRVGEFHLFQQSDR